MIVDGHVHVGAWNEPSFSGRATSLDDCVRVMRDSGISGALVMPTDQGDNEGLRRAILAHDGVDVALRLNAWVAPDDPDNAGWMDRHAEDIAAIKIHPSLLRRKPTDPVFDPFYARAKAHGWPVLIHTGRWQEMSGWPLALEVARAWPEVSFVLCHMGGDSTDLVEGVVSALAAADGPGNAFLGTESIRQYWVVDHAAKTLGAHRLVFGSDYNLNHPRSFIAVVEAMELSEAERETVLSGTLQGLLPARHRFSV